MRLLPDVPTQRTEFECCLFTDIFVFFQKILVQPSEQRGIEDTYRYVLKEHQRDANNGRGARPRAAVAGTRFVAPQNFILTPIIRLEHLLIKKKACGGNAEFMVNAGRSTRCIFDLFQVLALFMSLIPIRNS